MCAYCFETLPEPGGVFRDSSAASIDYEALMEEDMNGERRNLLHGYRGARLEEVSDPEHWMGLNFILKVKTVTWKEKEEQRMQKRRLQSTVLHKNEEKDENLTENHL